MMAACGAHACLSPTSSVCLWVGCFSERVNNCRQLAYDVGCASHGVEFGASFPSTPVAAVSGTAEPPSCHLPACCDVV